jgi:uracil-DNA glycosylase family 4
MSLEDLNKEIISCQRCPRLLEWASSRQGENSLYKEYNYWGKPVTGFGDVNGRLLIIGLAPGAHGANRTGRPFTGDTAGTYLYSALYRMGYSDKSVSRDRYDGLKLINTYITNVVRCVPPKDKPTSIEFTECRDYLRREMDQLTSVKVILTLGKMAFNQVKRILREANADVRGKSFRHGAVYQFGTNYPVMVCSYHTSRRNINANIMSDKILDEIFEKVSVELSR